MRWVSASVGLPQHRTSSRCHRHSAAASGFTQFVRCLLLAAYATSACALLAGCGKGANVKKGDPDYPEINPAPTRWLTLTARVPATLSVDFSVGYISEPTRSTNGYISCGFNPNIEVIRAFSADDPPLSMERMGDTLRAKIAVDKYLPGRCHWHFNGIGWQLANGADLFGGSMFAVAYDATRDAIDKVPRGPVYLVCKRDPTPRNPLRPGRCTSMDVMQSPMVGDVSQNLIAQLPSAARGKADVTWIMPDTTHIEISFYDLDTMVPTDSPLPLSQPTVSGYGTEPPPPK
jgi:hypothetical protein